jgi:hypothetical protein
MAMMTAHQRRDLAAALLAKVDESERAFGALSDNEKADQLISGAAKGMNERNKELVQRAQAHALIALYDRLAQL